MVDVVPVLLMTYGFISLVKPEWMMAVHRRQKAAGMTNRPEDIEPSDGVRALNAIFGVTFLLFGLVFTLRSL